MKKSELMAAIREVVKEEVSKQTKQLVNEIKKMTARNINEIRKDADTFIRFEDNKITLNSFGTTANSILEIGSLAGEESFVAKADTIKFQSYGANPIINISQGTNSTRFYQDVTGSGALLVTSNEINFTNLPTSDPGIAGRLYRDGSGNVKVSI